MDELIIEEKRYVSSKRAAKITGYAKDYIGQLCREGRVPARFVGRSWYVLESAISDHRFGDQKSEQELEVQKSIPPLKESASTWESPRYEAITPEPLPIMSRAAEPVSANGAPQGLQDSWKEWFDRFPEDKTIVVTPETSDSEEEKPNIRQEASQKADVEVNVPIHTVYSLPPEDLLPQPRKVANKAGEIEERPIRISVRREFVTPIIISGVIIAAITATFAVIGSGYFDKYILNYSQIQIISGVVEYNK